MKRGLTRKLVILGLSVMMALGISTTASAVTRTRKNVVINYDKVQHGYNSSYIFCKYDDFRFSLKNFRKHSFYHYYYNFYITRKIDHASWVRNNYNYNASGWKWARCWNISYARVRNRGGGTYSWKVKHSGW